MKRLTFIILALLVCRTTSATVAAVQSDTATGSSSLTLTATFTLQNDTAGNAIIAICTVANYNYETCNTPTDTEGGPSFVADAPENDSPNGPGIAVFHKFNITGGTKDAVTCNYTVAVGNHSCTIIEVSGVGALDVVSRTGFGNTYPTATTGTTATTQASVTEFVLGAFSIQDNTGTFTGLSDANYPYTGVNYNGYMLAEYQVVSTGGSGATYSATATYYGSSDYWAGWVSTYAAATTNYSISVSESGSTSESVSASQGSAATVDFGFDFRSTTGYVTDPTYAAAATIGPQTYPTTFTNGASATITAGWTNSTIEGRDRAAGNDPRLAGFEADSATGQTARTFEITLPSTGAYNIALAMGDQANPETQCVVLKDNATAFATYTAVATAANSFMDATGAVLTEANWITSNAPLNHTFASTTFNVVVGCGSGSNTSTLAHVRVTTAGGNASASVTESGSTSDVVSYSASGGVTGGPIIFKGDLIIKGHTLFSFVPSIGPSFHASVSESGSTSDSATATTSGGGGGSLTFLADLPSVLSGAPYSAWIVPINGTAPFTVTLASGSLPSGITLSNGMLNGSTSSTGSYSPVFHVSDSASNTGTYSPTLTVATVSGGDPALPTTWIDTTYPSTTGYVIKTVCASGCNYASVQAALSAVHSDGGDASGEIIELAAGATFTENVTLPNYTMTSGKWVIVTSNPSGFTPPAPGVRVTPLTMGNAATITTNNSSAAIATASNANHYRFMGVKFTVTAGFPTNYGIFVIGNGETSGGTLPDHIFLDRVYMSGNATGDLSRCVAANGATIALIDSYLASCAQTGGDSQAIAAWNSPGPIKIVNNYLAGATEGFLFGGVDPSISGLVMSDLEIRRNHIIKPLTWNPNDPSYAGVHWSVKDSFEFKNARRVLMEGNLAENSWGQTSSSQIWWTPRNQSGACTQCTVENITFRYNIVQHMGGGFTFSGADSASPCGDGAGPSQPMNNVKVSDTLLRDISHAAEWGSNSGYLAEPVNGKNTCTSSQTPAPNHIQMVHDTYLSNGSTSLMFFGDNFTNNPIAPFVFENNLLGATSNGILGTSTGEGASTLNAYTSSTTFTYNALTGLSSGDYTGYSGNFFPANTTLWGMTDLTNCSGGTWSIPACVLTSGSTYHAAGTDGKDLGADIGAVWSSTYGVQ